jgi:hypothetical protein
MNQGRQERREVDKAFMRELPGQSGMTSAFRVSVQSWELPQKACSSSKHQARGAYDITGEADKNRREDRPYFAVHLFPDGGSRRAEAIGCVHTEPDRKPKT